MHLKAIRPIALTVGVLAYLFLPGLKALGEPTKGLQKPAKNGGKDTAQQQASKVSAPGALPVTGTPTAPAASGKVGLDMSKPYGYHLEPILVKIQATADQKVKITNVVMSYRSSIEPLREQYRSKQQQFLDSMVSGDAAETMMAQQVELGNLSTRISSKYCLMRLEIRRFLNPQQILEFESYGREHGWNH